MVFLGEDKPLAVAKKLQKIYYLSPRDGKNFDFSLMIKHISLFSFTCFPSIAGISGFIHKSYCGKSEDCMNGVKSLTLPIIL